MILSFVLPSTVSVSADNTERYGYTLLANQIQKDAYKAIAEGIGKLQPEIKFTIAGITPEDVAAAGEMITRDYPEYFWYDGGANISVTGNDVTVSPANGHHVGGQQVTADSPALTPARIQRSRTHGICTG